MNHEWSDTNFPVSRFVDGRVLVGPRLAGAAGLGRLSLLGATLVMDPMTPHRPPSFEISDVAGADPVIRELLGDELADHVQRVDLASGGAVEEVSVPVVLSPRLTDLQNAATLLWLAEFLPWPPHPTLLTAELLVQISRVVDVLDDQDQIFESIAGYVPEFVEVLQRAATSADMADSVAQVLAAAGAAIVDTVPWHIPEKAQLLDAANELRDSRTGSELSGFDAAGILAACTPIPAGHAGVDGTRTFVGSATAHWGRNPGRLVSRDEDAVSWTLDVTPGEGARMTVVVPESPSHLALCHQDVPEVSPDDLIAALTPHEVLVSATPSCSLNVPSWPMPVTESVLERHQARGTWAGTLLVPADLVEPLDIALRTGDAMVDVHSSAIRYAPLRDLMADRDAARRWTVRALCASRIALDRPSSDLRVAIGQAWWRAITLWRGIDDSVSGQVAVRVQQCEAWRSCSEFSPGKESSALSGPPAENWLVGPGSLVGLQVTLTEKWVASTAGPPPS